MKEHNQVSFERFKKSRIFAGKSDNDLIVDFDLQCDEVVIYGGPHASWGYIEKHEVSIIVNGKPHGIVLYCLMLECDETYTSDLNLLEEKLYTYQFKMGSLDPSPSELRDRLLDISNNAVEAFWAEIAKGYAELKTGDLTPMATTEFNQAVFKVVTTWRDGNGGGLDVNK